MTTLASDAIPLAATILSVIPVIAGRRGWHRRQLAERLLWRWLALGSAIAVAMAVQRANGGYNVSIAQMTFPLFGWLGLDAMGALSGSEPIRRSFRGLALCYLVWWAFWVVDPAWMRSGFAVQNGTMLWVMLSLGGIVLLSVRLRDADCQPWRDAIALTAIGVLVSHFPGAALEIGWARIYTDSPEIARMLSLPRAVLAMVGYLLFTVAFLLPAERAT